MHTRIEDYSKLTAEELTHDINNWLGSLALLSQDLVDLKPAKYSEISESNPLANGVFLPIGKAVYGIPSVFRINVVPNPGIDYSHVRRMDGIGIDVSALAASDPKAYDFDTHGAASYNKNSPFTDGTFIEVKPSEQATGGLEAQVVTPSTTTHPVAGSSNEYSDEIHVPLRKLEEVRFEAVKLTGTVLEDRPRL